VIPDREITWDCLWKASHPSRVVDPSGHHHHIALELLRVLFGIATSFQQEHVPH